MKKIAIIYHSGYGHTEYFANHVLEGAGGVKGVEVVKLGVDEASKNVESLTRYDGLVFGSPTYMGNVSGPFKTFMDATSGLWMKGALRDKWAAGFTVSGSPSGDKFNTLVTLATFAAQHNMLWVSAGVPIEVYAGVKPEEAANRLGSFLGAMAQAGNVPPAEAFVPGDLKTARLFGERFAKVVAAR
jgi:multimeric flavodoxin WrbA